MYLPYYAWVTSPGTTISHVLSKTDSLKYQQACLQAQKIHINDQNCIMQNPGNTAWLSIIALIQHLTAWNMKEVVKCNVIFDTNSFYTKHKFTLRPCTRHLTFYLSSESSYSHRNRWVCIYFSKMNAKSKQLGVCLSIGPWSWFLMLFAGF